MRCQEIAAHFNGCEWAIQYFWDLFLNNENIAQLKIIIVILSLSSGEMRLFAVHCQRHRGKVSTPKFELLFFSSIETNRCWYCANGRVSYSPLHQCLGDNSNGVSQHERIIVIYSAFDSDLSFVIANIEPFKYYLSRLGFDQQVVQRNSNPKFTNIDQNTHQIRRRILQMTSFIYSFHFGHS